MALYRVIIVIALARLRTYIWRPTLLSPTANPLVFVDTAHPKPVGQMAAYVRLSVKKYAWLALFHGVASERAIRQQLPLLAV